jgi:RimJ/RimL family protein N-acetyltransferase
VDGLILREVDDADLGAFFGHQLDPEANRMAAFTRADPADRAGFDAHWARIRADPTVVIRTIVWDGRVAGHVLAYDDDGRTEVSYWIAREFWGRGMASAALRRFIGEVVTRRPLHARVAEGNDASLRVLRKCGFSVTGADRGFAPGRGADVDEHLLTLACDDRAETA